MPNIVLKEQDLTTVAVANESTDVVFVPGIADTNFNCFICYTPDATPSDFTLTPDRYAKGDTIHHKANGTYGNPSIFVNTFDKKAWKCIDNAGATPEWVEMDYTPVSPTNQPTYINSIVNFTSKFGKKAYTWNKSNYADDTSFDKARELPKFKENELPGDKDVAHYFYNDGDIEKSWLYAEELIYAGLPIFFEDVATLTNVGEEEVPVYVKELPVINNFYNALSNELTGKPDEDGYDGTHGVYTNYELFDIGEYNFKYVTSGGYPVFNVLSAVQDIPTDEAVENFVNGVTTVSHTTVDEDAGIEVLDEDGVRLADAFISNSGIVTVYASDTQAVTAGSFAVDTTTIAHTPASDIIEESIELTDANNAVISTAVTINASGVITSATFVDGKTASDVTGINYDYADDSHDEDVAYVSYTYQIGGDYVTIIDNMMKLCTERGDSYALIDHADNVLRPWYGSKSLFNAVQNVGIGDMGSRAAMFTPWATYSMNTMTLVTLMPASFGYLRTIANGIRVYNNYFAYAGVNRGEVPGIKELHCMYPLTNTVANDIQTKSGYSINPITFVKPYGLTIWGNRTLLEADGGLKATNFLNIRNLICEVQKTAYESAKVCLFENDNLGTWVKFVAPINALLQSMQDSGALKTYLVSRVPATGRGVINVDIRIVPTYAVEEFNITVILLDDGGITVEAE